MVKKYFEKGVKKRCEITKKGVKSLIWRHFQSKPMQIIYILVTFKSADYMVNKYLGKGVKKGVKSPKKV